MQIMKHIVHILGVVCGLMLLTTACSDKDEAGSISWNQKALFMHWGEEATVSFSGFNISSYSIASVPEGWDTPKIDAQSLTATIVAPAEDSGAAATGTIRLRGLTTGGEYIHSSLYVALNALEVDYTAQPANCYIANKPNAYYRFDAMRKGNGEQIATARVAVIWQTSMNQVQYLTFNDGECAFYIKAEDDDATKPKRGNVLLGAYDSADNLLWSWHVWITDMDVEGEVITNGEYELMGRQLGALACANDTPQEILDSYGVYYQLGRKDPFAGPSTYTASKGTTISLFDAESNTVTYQYPASSSETGNYSYANSHPTHFITTENKSENWCREMTNNVQGWNDTQKSVNDPCPYGWRVAPAAAFAGLTIADDLTVEDAATHYASSYGWQLTNGSASHFWFAAGRRIYLDGKIENLYNDTLVRNIATEAQPWVGYLWASEGTIFTYWFNKANPVTSGVRNDYQLGGANGLSVRCVREK